MKEFKFLDSREEAIGKTIKNIIKPKHLGNEDSEILFHFTDDTYLFMQANPIDHEDASIEDGYVLDLRNLHQYGLINLEEYNDENEKIKEEHDKQNKLWRKQQYEELKKEFEPGGPVMNG